MTLHNKIVEFRNREHLHEEAAEWIARIDAQGLTQSERQALIDWSNRSEYHRQILLDTAKVWDRMEVMSGLSELFALDNPPKKKRINHRIAIAAATVTGICILTLMYTGLQRPADLPDHQDVLTAVANVVTYRTEIGGSDVITLADGSVVKLNTGTRIEVDISSIRRSVIMLEGEAYFEVAKNQALPFVVTAGDTSFQALGTAFNVYKKADQQVEIMVTEGVVQVYRAEAANEGAASADYDPVLLRAGQMAEVNPPGIQRIEEIRSEEIARKLLWQQKMLAFEGDTLEQVINEFSRYTTLKIRIADAETAAIRVGGYFRSEDIAGLLSSLEENFSISVEQTAADSFSLKKHSG